MRVTVIGQGYVGLTVAIGAAEVGHDVVGLDLDKELIENLLKGITFIPGITEKSIKKLALSIAFQSLEETINMEIINWDKNMVYDERAVSVKEHNYN
jgi:UDP-glucose 6-dehydrogenase